MKRKKKMTKMLAVMVTTVIEDTDGLACAGDGDGGGGHDDHAIMATTGGIHVELMAMTKTTMIFLWAVMVTPILISHDF